MIINGLTALILAAGASGGVPASPPPFQSHGGASLVWKDANGTTVSGGITGPASVATGSVVPDSIYLVDPSGYIWAMTTTDAHLVPALGLNTVAFESADCTGPGYVFGSPMPRFTWQLFNESTFRTAKDDAAVVTVSLGSYLDAGGCEVGPFGDFTMVPLSSTISGIAAPSVSYRAPLHPELAP